MGSGPCAWTNAKYPDSWYRSPKSATRNLASISKNSKKEDRPSIEVHIRSNKGRGPGTKQASKQARKQKKRSRGEREERYAFPRPAQSLSRDGSQAEGPTAMCVLICTESGAAVEQPHRHGCSDEQELVMSETINITALLPQTE